VSAGYYLAKLEKEFDFIYLATGAHKSQKMGVPGEDMKNVYGGVEFLREFNANEDKWLKGEKTLGKKVAVIGAVILPSTLPRCCTSWRECHHSLSPLKTGYACSRGRN